jgi:hypothetical protein
MKRVLKLIDALHDADELYEYLLEEARKAKKKSLVEELAYHRNWFVRTVGKFRRPAP